MGKVKHWNNGKFAASSLLLVMSINDSDKYKYKYIHQYLKHNRAYICSKYAKGSSKITINKETFNNLKIPIPSPENQEKCIQIYQEKEKFLQSIDDKIEAEKKYIEELKQLSKDIIYSYC